MSKPIVILETARRDGETRRAIDVAFPHGSVDLVVLNDLKISGYDYNHRNAEDDFLPVVERMLKAQVIVFSTPVYWYAMSGSLKVFFDRLTDLMGAAKDKGRALRSKEVWLLATGTEDTLPEGFEVPFRRSADYLGMGYRGAGYLYTGDRQEHRERTEAAIREFGRKVLGHSASEPNSIQDATHPEAMIRSSELG